MNDTEKINTKLNEIGYGFDCCKADQCPAADTGKALIAALRIAVKGLERCQKRTLHAKNTIWAVAEALEGKP
jgi:hypothetical protein